MASLREQLKELENPNPSFKDPEEEYESLTVARLANKDSDVQPAGLDNQFGSIRNRVSTLLLEQDEKYQGTKISRRDINDEATSPNIMNMAADEEEDAASLEDEFELEAEFSDKDDIEDDGDDNEDILSMEDREDDDVMKQKSKYDDYDDDNDLQEDNSSNDGKSDDDDYDDEEINEENGVQEIENKDQVLEKILSKSVDDDVAKGAAVKSQLDLWDKFMEIRIKLQKCLQLSNKHPQHDVLPEFKKTSGAHVAKAQGEAKATLKLVLDNLISLKDMLYAKNAETNGLLTGKIAEKEKADSDEEIPSDTDEELEQDDNSHSKIDFSEQTKKRKLNLPTADYENEISKRHIAFQEFRDRTITKWDEKTKLSSGKLRSKTFAAFDRSAVAQIKQILSDKERLVKRTQLKRSFYRVLGKPPKQIIGGETLEDEMNEADAHLKNYDEEIFDDDDFYHQLIKELIERKSNLTSTNDPVTMGRQWLELQRWRKKAKRKIDVKASKGRRVRYTVHPKLVNIMAPVPAGSMSDQARNDLFSSLFGKRENKPIR